MYINFWYPIVLSEELVTGTPKKVKVLGLNFVAFRDGENNVHVLSDTCCHRGGSLGGAWSSLESAPRIIDGCIVCPYHGWEFDGAGNCVNIPSNGYGTKTPPRAKVDSYPVEEKYGVVFAFLGDLSETERPPLLTIEEYDQPGWHASPWLLYDVDFYYERSIENGLDPAHNEFVHPTHGFSGSNRDTYRVNDIELDDHRQGWGLWFWHNFDGPALPQSNHPTAKGGSTPWGQMKTERSFVKVGGGTYGPNCMPTYINFTPDKGMRQYFFEQPVESNKTIIFSLNMRNFLLGPEHDESILARNKIIAGQDVAILQEVHPTRTPLSNTKEALVPADQAIAAYRKWLRKFDEMGWRIDWKEFKRRSGGTDIDTDTAFAIPSPARRSKGNWVLDPIPLINATEQLKANNG